ncbi:MAG: DUF1080 domain-containing protein [Bacteroidales bacterium]|nr:DUF1080 domain-containing protein [Bacteroidales bacterium]
MKTFRILSIVFFCMLTFSSGLHAQDKRTLETKIADLLAQMPVNDLRLTDKLMGEMLLLGEEGLKQICSQIIPAGTGDDTRARFAVESFSRFISKPGNDNNRELWEKICIGFIGSRNDAGVRDFFIKQLQLIGGRNSVNTLKDLLSVRDLCEPAVAALQSIGGSEAESALADALKSGSLQCPASVLNALASMKSSLSVDEYIRFASDKNPDIRSSALNAPAQSASPLAYPVLVRAASSAGYKWEPTGAVDALLNYARNVAMKGDLKTMDKISKLIMSECKDPLSVHYRIAALENMISFHKADAMKQVIKAMKDPDKAFRNGVLQASLSISRPAITEEWIKYFPKAPAEAKPEIITMLGLRGDKNAIPLLTSALSHEDQNVRIESATALSKLAKGEAVSPLIGYLKKYTDKNDQEAARTALISSGGNDMVAQLLPVLKEGPAEAKKTAMEIMAWNKGNQYFKEILNFTSSSDTALRNTAYRSLSAMAEPGDQKELIDLIIKTADPELVGYVREALATAAGKIENPSQRSEEILKAINEKGAKEKLIPVLAQTGGREALALVLKEFEQGNPEMRDICFKTLTSWHDHTASSALYEICASGNKTFEAPAFEGYVRQVRTAQLPDEQKLLLLRKIMPYARSAQRKNQIISEIGRLKTYQALFFVSNYLDDPETSSAAASAAMNIALPSSGSSNGMYGTMVRDILTRAIPKLTGSESEYEKERVVKYLASMSADEGFKPMFNGKDLTGWQGLVENPIARAKMRKTDLERKQAEANVKVPANWSVKDGCIWFNGKGDNLCSVVEYGDFELLVDWKISKGGDSGIYLRGTPQVQIWDTSRTEVGAQVGSGGLYNNQKNPSKPLKVADNPVGDWNTFRIIMIGEKVSVWLNGELVVDNVTMENYWDRSIPIFPKGPIELQAHGTDLAFRDIYVREISEKEYNLTPEEKADGFVALFNGRNLDNWIGDKKSYVVEDGMIVIKPQEGSGGNLYTEKEYSDFIFRFEFQLTPAANNGLGIRAPLEGDAAYVGMELQILDDTAPVYANLRPYQYHGSIYGVVPAKRGFLKPVGEWNYEEVYAKDTHIRITLNGNVIVDADIAEARDKGTMDGNQHPGLKNKSGHIGFLGHGSVVKFRNIRIKELASQ